MAIGRSQRTDRSRHFAAELERDTMNTCILPRRRSGACLTMRVMVVTVVLTACANDEQPAPAVPQSIVADVIVAVTNQTSREQSIVLDVGAIEHSLGAVPSRSSRSFSLPSSAGDSTSELQLEARERRATSGLRSGVFHVSSGQRVVWTLDSRGRGVLVTR